MIGGEPFGSTPPGGSMLTEEDNSVYRQKIAKKLRAMQGFDGLVEEYPVHLGETGGVIDILVRFTSPYEKVYFVIECKDFRDDSINLPQSPIPESDKNSWGFYYEFTGKDSLRHPIRDIKTYPTFYSTDISCQIKKNGKSQRYNFDMFHKWSLQVSANFMGFAVGERKARDTKSGMMDNFYAFPILVTATSIEMSEALVINPHPFTFDHLAVQSNNYVDPLQRGELEKHAFMLVSDKFLEESITELISETDK